MIRTRRAVHLLAIAVFAIALLFPGLYSSPRAIAAPLLTLSKTSGYVEDIVTASVSGFPKYRTVTFFWDGKALGSMRATSTGDGFLTFAIPVARKGAHAVAATSNSISSTTTFTVKPRLRVDPVVTTVGSPLIATLRGYARGETVGISLDSTTRVLQSIVVSGSGSATVKMTVPAAVAGKHKLIGSGNSESFASATFSIVPSVTLSPASGSPGTKVRALVRGFAKNQQVEVQWIDELLHSHSLAIVTTSSTGSANVDITVPFDAVPGSYSIRVVSDNVNVAQSTFEVT